MADAQPEPEWESGESDGSVLSENGAEDWDGIPDEVSDVSEDAHPIQPLFIAGWEPSDTEDNAAQVSNGTGWGDWGEGAAPADREWRVGATPNGGGVSIYEDDDLGWAVSIRWRGWRWGSPVAPPQPFGVVPPTDPAGVVPPNNALPPHPGNRLPAGQFFLFVELLERLIPPVDRLAVGSFWRPENPGGLALQDIKHVLCVCQVWHDTANSLGAIWGAFIPVAHNEHTLAVMLERARGANIRLAYTRGIPKAVTDALLPRATAIYAGQDCPWRNFARVLGQRLPLLQVLILRPDATGASSSPLRSFDGVLDAPSMYICELSCPLPLNAPGLLRLAIRFCTSPQIERVLSSIAEVSLLRLVLESIPDTQRMNLTALLRRIRPDRLSFLRIGASYSQVAGMDFSSAKVSFPELDTVDLPGPTWLGAPNIRFAKIFNINADEALCMLDGLSNAEVLHIRGRADGDLHPRTPVQASHHVELPIELVRAHTIYLAGVMSEDTWTLLDGIFAKNLRYLHMFCDMPAAPDHGALDDVRGRIQTSLAASSATAASATLRTALLQAQAALRAVGHHVMARKLNDIDGYPVGEWGFGPAHEVNDVPPWAQLEAAAQEAMGTLAAAFEQPPARHNGFLLNRVASAALDVMDIEDLEAFETEFDITPEGKGVCCTARIGERRLAFVMADSDSNEWPKAWGQDARVDSGIFGLSRLLFGLSFLKPVYLKFSDDRFRSLGWGPERADKRALRQVLRGYDRVTSLILDYAWTGYTRFELLDVLADPTTLPRMQRLVVLCAPPHDKPIGEYLNGEYFGPTPDEAQKVVRAVLRMLDARSAHADEGVDYLDLRGGFCMSEDLVNDAQGLVGRLLMDEVKCVRPGGAEFCAICSAWW
ncbi:unnamed protein product [Peniophora sp. CBMAI 1063]|nr:unnamed protein product [Peniophora sp. CBMAI 1063]